MPNTTAQTSRRAWGWLGFLGTHSNRLGSPWLPVLLGAIILGVTLILWDRLCRERREEIGRLLQATAASVQQELSQELKDRLRSLAYLSDRWQTNAPPTRQDWEADSTLFVRHSPSLQAVEWVDPQLFVRWVAPLAGNEAILNQPSAPEPRRLEALNTARTRRQPAFTRAINLKQGGQGFLVYIPLFRETKFDGFLVGVFHAQKLFDTVLANWSKDFAVDIFNDDQRVYRRGAAETDGPLAQTQERKFEVYGVTWRVSVSPTAGGKQASLLQTPEIFLGCGIVVSLLVAGLVFFYQAAWRRGRELEQALSEVRTLQGIIPICSGCKMIRDDQGYWSQVEGYIMQHSQAQFSHSLCPKCAERYFPEKL